MIAVYLSVLALHTPSNIFVRTVILPHSRSALITAQAVANEFARPVSISSVDRKAKRTELEATPEECAALAERFELESIGSLVANVSLALVDKRRTRIRASGKLSAGDVRRISFSGDVATVQVDSIAFETHFMPEEELNTGGSMETEDEFKYDEAIENDQIDTGELVAQHLYLYLYGLSLQEEQEWSDEVVEGTVVYDSNPELD